MKKQPTHEPPKYLSESARDWFLSLQAEYGIFDTGGVSLLTSAAEAWDRCRSAREAIAADGGPVIRDRFDQTKAHPAAAIERDARSQFITALKALNLDIEPLRDKPGRPTQAETWRKK
jgi:phage terminase small subunit